MDMHCRYIFIQCDFFEFWKKWTLNFRDTATQEGLPYTTVKYPQLYYGFMMLVYQSKKVEKGDKKTHRIS